jgi:hypothetical protein
MESLSILIRGAPRPWRKKRAVLSRSPKVVTAVDFSPYRVIAVGVFDPSPTIGGTRALSPAEIVRMNRGGQLRFLGALTVTSVTEAVGDDGSDDGDE